LIKFEPNSDNARGAGGAQGAAPPLWR
jgi:hypothetical protein